MTTEGETLTEMVDRVSTVTVSQTDRVMICGHCNQMEVAKTGEFHGVYHDCGEKMEQMGCSKCDQPATRIVNLGMTLIGEEAGAHLESNESPRCEAHRRL
jgi:hypothetical protein